MSSDDATRLERGRSTLFAQPVWFRHWLPAFGGDDAGIWHPAANPDGLAIPYLRETSMIGPFRVPVARAAANAHTPRYDSCGTRSPSGKDLREMMAKLEVSALIFPFVPWDSRLGRTLADARNHLGWYRDYCETAPYIDCTGDWDAYLATRGKQHRWNWLYYERRANKAGVTFENLTTWKAISEVFEQILQVEASGWKGRGGTAIMQDEVVRRFYEGLCRDLADQGELRVFLYRRGEQIVAFQICSLHDDTLSCLKIGYLEEFARESPGQVLQLWILKWAFAHPGVDKFDLLGPASEWKLRWATGVEELYTLFVFRRSLGGLIARGRWEIGPELKQRLRARVDKLKPILRRVRGPGGPPAGDQSPEHTPTTSPS